jgi:phosphoribosylglycinamide formyltransferase 1
MNIVTLISGNGSNLQAIIDAIADGLPVTISAVISNRPSAFGLTRASNAGIPAITIDHTTYASREAFDLKLQQTIDAYNPDYIVLAGFMRLLSADFVRHFKGKILNIHPSLLPKYPGLNTHQRAIDAGDTQHGATVHYVTEDLDAGPIIDQARCHIEKTDTADILQKKVHAIEHALYPDVLRHLVT